MSFNAKDREGGNFKPIEPLDPKAYPARLVMLVTMGMQPGSIYLGVQKDPTERLYVAYEFSHEFLKDDNDNPDAAKPRWIGEDFPFYSLDSDRAKSTKRYEALDPGTIHDGDWLRLLSAPCQVTLTKEPRKNGKGDTNYVSDVSSAADIPGYDQPPLVNPPRIFDFDDPDMEVFKDLPKWLKEKLVKALNFEGSALQKALGEAPKEAETPTNSTSAPTPPIPPAPPMPPASNAS